MLLVRANHPDHPTAADNLALVANLFYRCSNLHRVLRSPLTTFRRSARDSDRSASTPLEPDPRRSRGRNCVRRDSPGAPSPGAAPRARPEPAGSGAARGRRLQPFYPSTRSRVHVAHTFARSGLAPATPTRARPGLPARQAASARGTRPRSRRRCARSAPTVPCLS